MLSLREVSFEKKKFLVFFFFYRILFCLTHIYYRHNSFNCHWILWKKKLLYASAAMLFSSLLFYRIGAGIMQIFNTHCLSLWCYVCVCWCCLLFFFLLSSMLCVPIKPKFSSVWTCHLARWMHPNGKFRELKKKNQHNTTTGCWIFQQFLFYSFASAFTFHRSFFLTCSSSSSSSNSGKRRWKTPKMQK